MKTTLTLLLSLLLFACGPQIKEEELDTHVEDLLTISQGVYGQATSVDDVCTPTCERNYATMTFNVHSATDPSLPGVEVKTGERGFYEVALDVGSYEICTSFGRCKQFVVQPQQLVRLDYEFSNGPGWSSPTGQPATSSSSSSGSTP